MSKYTVLDHVHHSELKVKMEYGDKYGSNVNQVLVFPTEFQSLQREFPILFRQDEQQKYYAVVITGLDKDDNLFLDEGQWSTRYIPAIQSRGPFALEVSELAGKPADPSVLIDLEDSRVSQSEGEPLFLAHGGYTPYFKETLDCLRRLNVGASVVDEFFSQLVAFELIEPIAVEVNFSESMSYTIPDVFTISQARMQSLTGEELHKLNQLGLLEHCFAVMSSTANMSRLVDMKALRINRV